MIFEISNRTFGSFYCGFDLQITVELTYKFQHLNLFLRNKIFSRTYLAWLPQFYAKTRYGSYSMNLIYAKNENW